MRRSFSGLAYTLVEALRRMGLKGTEWAEVRVDTIRLKLLKIARPSASACAASSSSSVRLIPGKTSSRRPSTPSAVERARSIEPTPVPTLPPSSRGRSHAQNRTETIESNKQDTDPTESSPPDQPSQPKSPPKQDTGVSERVRGVGVWPGVGRKRAVTIMGRAYSSIG